MGRKIKILKQNYENVCNEYVQEFCNKQDMSFEFWVDTIGGIALCSDFYLNFNDIVYDINSKQPKARIIDWYNNTITNHPNEVDNYFTYCKQLDNEN